MKLIQVFLWLAVCVFCANSHAADARKPNLILIMADDLGYETIGANGGTSYRVIGRLCSRSLLPPEHASRIATPNRSAHRRECS
jgi:arylsulfatase A-like enzyme